MANKYILAFAMIFFAGTGLLRFLMVKHLDGNRKKEEDGIFLTNQYGRYPIVEHPEYPEWWLRLIVELTGERFLLRE